MIRVLLVPAYFSSDSITGISLVNFQLDIARMVNAKRNDVAWSLAVPETSQFCRWGPEDIAGIERMEFLPLMAPGGANETGFEQDGFSGLDYPFFGSKAFEFFSSQDYMMFDVVFSRQFIANMIPQFQAVQWAWTDFLKPKVGLPTLVNFLTETGADPQLPLLRTKEAYTCLAASIAASDFQVVLSGVDVLELKKIARTCLSPSIAREIRIERPLPAVSLKDVPVFKRPAERCTFFHGGTFEAKRNLQFIVAAVGKAFAAGYDVRLLLTTQRRNVPDWARQPYVEVRTGVSRAEYHRLLELGDFLTCYVNYEGTGIGYSEAIASGMTPIIMRKPWNEARIPEGYVFGTTSDREFEKVVMFCASNPRKAKKAGDRMIDFTRKLYDPGRAADFWSGFIDRCVERRHQSTLMRLRDTFYTRLVRVAVDGLDTCVVSKAQLLDEISRRSSEFKPMRVPAGQLRESFRPETFSPKRLDKIWPMLRELSSALKPDLIIEDDYENPFRQQL